jgi:hypothetical protein
MADDLRLSLLAFPQGIADGRLALRLLVAPTRDPLAPLAAGLPAFADLPLPLEIRLLPGLERLPQPGEGRVVAASTLGPGPQAREVLEALEARLPVDASPPPADPGLGRLRVLKVATPGYLAAIGGGRLGTPFLTDADTYACAMRDATDPARRPPAPPPRAGLRWGEILARALRQPLLARAVGMVHALEVDLDEEALAEGGFLWVEPAPGAPLAAAAAGTPGLLRLYAARLPRVPAGQARPLAAAVLFPVRAGVPPGPRLDPIFAEAEAFSDGFARVVHASQPDRHDPFGVSVGAQPLRPISDEGVRIGWDDEQLLVWMNRQFAEDPRNAVAPGGPSRDAPLGVLGWRLDVRDVTGGAGPWTSLVRVAGGLGLAGIDLGRYEGDLAVEIVPTLHQRLAADGGAATDRAWLPPDAVRWAGGSLLGGDALRAALGGGAGPTPPLPPDPVAAVPLQYGRLYEFRARLMDLAGGGPPVDASPVNPGRAGAARLRFRRFVPPRDVVAGRPQEVQGERRVVVNVFRPSIGAPDALFLDGDADARRAALLAAATAAGGKDREPSVADTDVTLLRLDLAVGMPDGDADNTPGAVTSRRPLFGTPLLRRFPDDPEVPLRLVFTFADVERLGALPAPGEDGEIVLPASRDIFVTATPIARPDPAMLRSGAEDPALVGTLPRAELTRPDPGLEYYGNQAARIGRSITWELRQGPADETGLIQPAAAHPPLAALLIAPPRPGEPGPAARLAAALRLRKRGLALSAPPGPRTVMACSPRLAHIHAADRATLTFGSEAELADRWIVAVRLTLARDWSWDGLDPAGLKVLRIEEDGREVEAGRLPLPRLVAPSATGRDGTELLFLDLVEPSAAEERRLRWRVEAVLGEAPAVAPEAWTGELRLPVALPPREAPALVSAGIAVSAFEAAPDYSATARRDRMLWLEFDVPPPGPRDLVFGRVLAWAPDPALTGALPPATDAEDPPLMLPDEPVRVIVPAQADDEAGLDAMQPLLPTDSPRRFLLPLPPDVAPGGPELFGLFRYEFRFGHGRGLWSTARARFGPPRRVEGVRHPPPELPCRPERRPDAVLAEAPFAMPDAAEHPADLSRSTRGEMWFLLYAQVMRADGGGMRNLLLSSQRGKKPDAPTSRPDGRWAQARWPLKEVWECLGALALDPGAPLSVIAAELLPPSADEGFPEPLGADLGEVSLLRVSRLVAVPDRCPS